MVALGQPRLQLSQVADGGDGSYAVVSPPPMLIADIWDPSRGLCEKIRNACEVARREGYDYI